MEDFISFEDRYYHRVEPQKLCPNCLSSNVARVSRINPDSTARYGDIWYKYHCNNCNREGKEILNSDIAAWNIFLTEGVQPNEN